MASVAMNPKRTVRAATQTLQAHFGQHLLAFFAQVATREATHKTLAREEEVNKRSIKFIHPNLDRAKNSSDFPLIPVV